MGKRLPARRPGSRGDQDFKWAVEHAACCHMRPNAGQLTVKVGTNTHGDTGCSSPSNIQEGLFDLPLESAYQINCQRIRELGYCATRTNPPGE